MYFSRTDAKENRVFGGFGGLVGMAAFRWIGEERGERKTQSLTTCSGEAPSPPRVKSVPPASYILE